MDTTDPNGRAVYDAAAAIHEGSVQRLVERSHPLAVPAPLPVRLSFRRRRVGRHHGRRTIPWDAALTAAERLWPPLRRPRVPCAPPSACSISPTGRSIPRRSPSSRRPVAAPVPPRACSPSPAPLATRPRSRSMRTSTSSRCSACRSPADPSWSPGRPVMITAKRLPARACFNGDQGLIVRRRRGPRPPPLPRRVSAQPARFRPFAIEALRDRLELSWAMTVHKSQGSELDAIALILPHEDLPIVTRELILPPASRGLAPALPSSARGSLFDRRWASAARCATRAWPTDSARCWRP